MNLRLYTIDSTLESQWSLLGRIVLLLRRVVHGVVPYVD